jgi:hypothetical protein
MTQLGDVEIRRLHSEFNACLAYANWQLAAEEADELAAKQIADFHTSKAIKQASLSPDPFTNKDKKVAQLEAEAAGDEKVQEWRRKHLSHVVAIKFYKSLRDTYQSNCERISREWTMRTDERAVTR